MKLLNPKLKTALCIVGVAVVGLIIPLNAGYYGVFDDDTANLLYFIFTQIALFLSPIALIWLCIRNLAKPIKHIFIGLYIAVFGTLLFHTKVASTNVLFVEPLPLLPMIFGFVIVAAFMPLFFKNTEAGSLAGVGKISLWTAILWFDFAFAFPRIHFEDLDTEGIYKGYISDNNGKRKSVIAFAPNNYYGFNDIEDVYVFPVAGDSVCISEYKVYRHCWGDKFITDTVGYDTLWLNDNWQFMRDGSKRNLTYIETSVLMNQWQYLLFNFVRCTE